MDFLNKTLSGDVIEILPTLPEKIVQTVVTSPPYFAVRDYKLEPTPWPEITYSLFGFPITIPAGECCLGLEKTPIEFIGHLVHVFREVRRVLRDDGTIWVNMGDCYNSNSGGYKPGTRGKHNYISDGTAQEVLKNHRRLPGMKRKDMVGIPWMMAFALRDDGWFLRQDIIWHKNNPMPESVNDRCTKAHEYIFLLSKSKRYYYDSYAISTEIADSSVIRFKQNLENQTGSTRANGGMRHNGPLKATAKYMPEHKNLQRDDKNHSMHEARKVRREEEKNYDINGKGFQGHSGYFDSNGNLLGNGRANKKSVWSITTQSFSEAHFATFPEELPIDPIKAGSSDHGCCAECRTPYKRNRKTLKFEKDCACNTDEVVPCIVMDCFSGAGTTRLVARKLNRSFIGIDKNPEYNKIEEARIYKELGMFR